MSTDLGVAYYYTNQPDRALEQFEQSLSVDPKHTKTLLNIGIVKAFGKQDLAGAAQAWQQVVALAPDSPEGQAAKKALEGLQSAHPDTTPGGGRPIAVLLRAFLSFCWSLFLARAVWRLLSGVVQGASAGRCDAARPSPGAPPAVKMARDPVCGTYVVPGKALSWPAAARRCISAPRSAVLSTSTLRRRPLGAARMGSPSLRDGEGIARDPKSRHAPTSSKSAAGCGSAATSRRTTATSASASTNAA